jgi:hypothetical protein
MVGALPESYFSFTAIMDSPSQTDLIRAWFDQGGTLTVLEALQRFNCYALSQRCTELRKEGYPVVSELEITPTGKRVARYSKLLVPYG